MHYLDNAATTRVDPRVADVVDRALREVWANPSSLYGPGYEAEEALHGARRTLAAALGIKGPLDERNPEIIFTGSGTEANNIAVLAAARARRGWGSHIVTTGYEHPSVRRPLERLEAEGFTVTRICPAKNGEVYAEELVQAVGEKTVLVAAMQLNNETGATLDVAGIAAAAKTRNNRTAVHVDAVQSFLKLPLDVSHIDTVALSAHKLHGPKGVGALYLRKGFAGDDFRAALPLLGGGQEGGLRPGTENAPYILGFEEAVRLAQKSREEDVRTIALLQLQLMAGLAGIEGIEINSPANAWPGILNISLPGVKSEVMLHHLEAQSVYLSSGSACARGERSHTLAAMGLPGARVDSALRVSLCAYNTAEDIDALLAGLASGLTTLVR